MALAVQTMTTQLTTRLVRHQLASMHRQPLKLALISVAYLEVKLTVASPDQRRGAFVHQIVQSNVSAANHKLIFGVGRPITVKFLRHSTCVRFLPDIHSQRPRDALDY
jgi:hypothetical protein